MSDHDSPAEVVAAAAAEDAAPAVADGEQPEANDPSGPDGDAAGAVEATGGVDGAAAAAAAAAGDSDGEAALLVGANSGPQKMNGSDNIEVWPDFVEKAQYDKEGHPAIAAQGYLSKVKPGTGGKRVQKQRFFVLTATHLCHFFSKEHARISEGGYLLGDCAHSSLSTFSQHGARFALSAIQRIVNHPTTPTLTVMRLGKQDAFFLQAATVEDARGWQDLIEDWAADGAGLVAEYLESAGGAEAVGHLLPTDAEDGSPPADHPGSGSEVGAADEPGKAEGKGDEAAKPKRGSVLRSMMPSWMGGGGGGGGAAAPAAAPTAGGSPGRAKRMSFSLRRRTSLTPEQQAEKEKQQAEKAAKAAEQKAEKAEEDERKRAEAAEQREVEEARRIEEARAAAAERRKAARAAWEEEEEHARVHYKPTLPSQAAAADLCSAAGKPYLTNSKDEPLAVLSGWLSKREESVLSRGPALRERYFVLTPWAICFFCSESAAKLSKERYMGGKASGSAPSRMLGTGGKVPLEKLMEVRVKQWKRGERDADVQQRKLEKGVLDERDIAMATQNRLRKTALALSGASSRYYARAEDEEEEYEEDEEEGEEDEDEEEGEEDQDDDDDDDADDDGEFKSGFGAVEEDDPDEMLDRTVLELDIFDDVMEVDCHTEEARDMWVGHLRRWMKWWKEARDKQQMAAWGEFASRRDMSAAADPVAAQQKRAAGGGGGRGRGRGRGRKYITRGQGAN